MISGAKTMIRPTAGKPINNVRLFEYAVSFLNSPILLSAISFVARGKKIALIDVRTVITISTTLIPTE